MRVVLCAAGVAAAGGSDLHHVDCRGFVLVAAVAAGTLSLGGPPTPGRTLWLWNWLDIGRLDADFAYFIDPLTMLMLLVVTGVGSLIAIYAAGYMKGDPGYARFFASVSLFIFAMTTLVMADNLILLYSGGRAWGCARTC